MNIKPHIEGYYTTDDIKEKTGKNGEWVYDRIRNPKRMFLVCRLGWYYYIEKTSFDRWWNDGNPLRYPKKKRYIKKGSDLPNRNCEDFYGCKIKEFKKQSRRKECPIDCHLFRLKEDYTRYAEIIDVATSHEIRRYKSINNLIAAKGADLMPKNEI